MKTLVAILLFSLQTWGLEVAFFAPPAGFNHPWGKYYHTALFTNKFWIHAWPMKGVVIVEDIQKVGHIGIILESPKNFVVSDQAIKRQLGKAFDGTYDWYSKDQTHCTKLIADLLGIPPRKKPEPPYIGLTPEELFQELIKRNWKPIK